MSQSPEVFPKEESLADQLGKIDALNLSEEDVLAALDETDTEAEERHRDLLDIEGPE